MDYMTLKQAGEKWGISPRMINYYCSAGRIAGGRKNGNSLVNTKGRRKTHRRKIKRKAGEFEMKHILIIDDDIHIGNIIEEALIKEDYQVSRAYSGTEALYVLSASKPDLILLDLMLPGLSGEEVLPQIKDIPVIVVSAKIDIDDKVELLLGGAADYITKPFEMKELLARITVALRSGVTAVNSKECPSSFLSFDNLRLDIMTHEVFAGQQGVNLTRTEYAILKILMQNPSQVIAKSLLLERISEDTPDCTDSSLKTHISHLRKKLRDIGGKEYIDAVWGIGFKLKSE